MKILLLIPSSYTLYKTIDNGFSRLGFTVYHHDYRNFITRWQNQINTQIFRLPYRYREKWETYFLPRINQKHREIFDRENPDIVFIYNNEMLLPETIEYFKKNRAKIIFIMGDSPYYTPTNRYYMSLLFLADLIISPDSFWADQLKLLGIKNVVVDFPGFDESLMEFRQPTDSERKAYECEVLFVGTGYADTWGYKRALFLSKLANFDTRIYGNNKWLRWLEFFPELKPKFHLLKNRISLEQLVMMSKCARVYPVDANPAILNGVHLRVFDCISMGVLPMVEYRKDHESFFKGVELPLIHTYDEAGNVAQKYLKNDDLREKTLQELQQFVKTKFAADVVLKRILEKF